MRPQVVTVSAQAISVPLPVNRLERNFKLGMGVTVTGGASLTYSVQHSFDAPTDFASQTDYNTNAEWLETAGLSGLTATDDGNIAFPVQSVRLNVTTFVSGSATLTVLQAT